MYYLVDCDIARGVGLLIVNKDSRKGSQNVKTNNIYTDISTFIATSPRFIMENEEILSCKLAHPIQFSV